MSPAARYAYAIVAAFIVSLIRIAFNPLWGPHFPYLLYFPVTLFSALLAGLTPASVGIVITASMTFIWVLPPVGVPWVDDPVHLLGLGFYIIVDSLIAWLGAQHRELLFDTERQSAEKAVRKSEERFGMMVEGIKDYAIIMLDPAGRVLNWNAGAQRLFGYEPAEIIGRSFSLFFSPEAVREGRPVHELTVAAAEGKYEVQDWRFRKDGSQFWGNGITAAIRNDSGVLEGFSKVVRDLTVHRRAEQMQLRFIEKAMAVSEEERRQLASALHHEVGQALTKLLVELADVGAARTLDEAKRKSNAVRILAAEALQELRRLSLGLRPSLAADLGLEDALRHYISDYGQTHGIAMRMEVNGMEGHRLPEAMETRLYRVVLEALANIVQHAGAHLAKINLRRGAAEVLLTIEDDGIGFDMAEKMQTAVATAAPHLGLWAMKEYARQMNGTLTIDSSPGRGTTVTVVVPLQTS